MSNVIAVVRAIEVDTVPASINFISGFKPPYDTLEKAYCGKIMLDRIPPGHGWFGR
jgi:hypothetical protein